MSCDEGYLGERITDARRESKLHNTARSPNRVGLRVTHAVLSAGEMRAVHASFSVGAAALGWLLVSPPASAQPFPVPVGPPLPFPPFGGPELPIEAETPLASEPALPARSARQESTHFDATLHASSKAEAEALVQSRWHETWYGWQTLTVDATAIGVLLIGAALGPTRPTELGQSTLPLTTPASAGMYALGPAGVHLAHGNVWKGFASIGLRVVMPLAGFAFGYVASGVLRRERTGTVEDGGFGALVGGAGAMAADAVALGWDRWYGAQAPALLSMRASF